MRKYKYKSEFLDRHAKDFSRAKHHLLKVMWKKRPYKHFDINKIHLTSSMWRTQNDLNEIAFIYREIFMKIITEEYGP